MLYYIKYAGKTTIKFKDAELIIFISNRENYKTGACNVVYRFKEVKIYTPEIVDYHIEPSKDALTVTTRDGRNCTFYIMDDLLPSLRYCTTPLDEINLLSKDIVYIDTNFVDFLIKEHILNE